MKADGRILIFGDICPDNDYRKQFDQNPAAVFSAELVEDMAAAGLVVGNLECPATDSCLAISKCGPSLRACPQDIERLRSAGFDVLSLANNHILDYGEVGVEDTLRLCEKSGIKAVGAGHTAPAARTPLLVSVAGKQVGIVSFAEAEFNLATDTRPGANHFDPYESYDQISELKAQCDYMIVLYHGGIEYCKAPSPLLQKKCRKFIRSGADLVLCQHSHCIGTVEHIENGTILYGQGNSVFGYRQGSASWNEGLVVAVELLDTPAVSFRLIQATPEGITYASAEAQEARLLQLEEDSRHLGDPAWIKTQWQEFALAQQALDMPLLYGWGRVLIKLNRMLANKLIGLRYSRKKQMITMNLLRCEAHHEVIRTILENKVFGEK